jgi:hypothetical protein
MRHRGDWGCLIFLIALAMAGLALAGGFGEETILISMWSLFN